MRRFSLLLLVVIAGLLFGGCTAARKPVPPAQPRTVVVPAEKSISFDRVDPAKAPDEVKDVAKAMGNTAGTAWVRTGTDTYLLLNQGPQARRLKAEINDVVQRIPRDNFTWLEVKVKYTRQAAVPAAPAGPVLTIARVGKLDRTINGVGFTFSRPAHVPAAPPPSGARPSPAPPAATAGLAAISTPAAGSTITSPVKVSGQGRHPGGELHISLVDGRGHTLAGAPVKVPAGHMGPFETTLHYTAPASPQTGYVEVLAVDGGQEKLLSRVQVTIR
ncbi:Gmad2 immunoglobulin-like domain-containing protein [Desulfotomaculum copahuensis]|uniref:Bacterial spore germination immunoglobulin-like domain-containing protein n=1 Tax=Desulfotomaculum copahuensis TaxID=1838280 RepID=A0A1B7LIS4_9FIRM|nr:Gmad2 immunoglobulin-like domain-containing protein [Desulfotomaculum copahuensis]OAT86446.1 hypothetical protein A6M21_03205 [Desulfotomaculum copahuensis]